MHDLNKSDFENVCRELFSAFQGVLSWQWESRFETALAEFSVDNKDKVRAILERYLNIAWDSSSIGKAPDNVQKIANYLGGLRSEQLLFTSDPNQDAFIFGAWWPWGDGQTISIRIAPSDKKLSDSEMAETAIQAGVTGEGNLFATKDEMSKARSYFPRYPRVSGGMILPSLEEMSAPDLIIFPANGYQMCMISTAYTYDTGEIITGYVGSATCMMTVALLYLRTDPSSPAEITVEEIL